MKGPTKVPTLFGVVIRVLTDVFDSLTVRYFRALYSYDPHQQSPNKEFAHEELPFMEGDVISVCGVYVWVWVCEGGCRECVVCGGGGGVHAATVM